MPKAGHRPGVSAVLLARELLSNKKRAAKNMVFLTCVCAHLARGHQAMYPKLISTSMPDVQLRVSRRREQPCGHFSHSFQMWKDALAFLCDVTDLSQLCATRQKFRAFASDEFFT